MTLTEAPPAEARTAPARRRSHVLGAALLGAVDGLLGIALPSAVLAAIGVLAWAGLGSPTDWTPYVRAAAVVELLGHGVDVRFGSAGFTATIALLGPALVTAAAAVRAGRRAARTAAPLAAWAGGGVGTAVASAGLLVVATTPLAQPVAWQAVLLPAALVAAASLVALRHARGAAALPAGIRVGLAGAALVLGSAAVGLAVLLLARFADVVALYEGLAPGPVGGLALTAAQLLALPALVVWAAAWTTGAGVGLGTGSVTGAFGTQIGPLPGLPVLGVVPTETGPLASAVVLLPVLAGFTAGALARRAGVRTSAPVLAAVAGVTAGAVLGLLAAAASGAAGPGRFVSVGPDALLVAALAAVEIGVPVLLAAAVVRVPGAGEADPGGQ